ncbi:hypothetical protein EDB81DRAFT_887529 [Dactylonectria macrodidyma]|uniref:Uncharacterized protein n=1 Tax=Dactylonectria macrodidyma TaxID=307937 RepID=A0A9P9EAA9_9HYPO|nr:hypothetical protein EDB81DRAFT_887529 [Dactylonectria macrodidyma]
MLRSMLAGTSTAAVVGLTASFVGASLWGTAGLSFIVGSTAGFALDSIKWYLAASQEALVQLDKYPSILRLHLVSNFPWKPDFGRLGVEWYTSRRFSTNWQMKSILISAWLTAQPALDEIRSRTEAGLVESYSKERIVQRGQSREREDAVEKSQSE